MPPKDHHIPSASLELFEQYAPPGPGEVFASGGIKAVLKYIQDDIHRNVNKPGNEFKIGNKKLSYKKAKWLHNKEIPLYKKINYLAGQLLGPRGKDITPEQRQYLFNALNALQQQMETDSEDTEKSGISLNNPAKRKIHLYLDNDQFFVRMELEDFKAGLSLPEQGQKVLTLPQNRETIPGKITKLLKFDANYDMYQLVDRQVEGDTLRHLLSRKYQAVVTDTAAQGNELVGTFQSEAGIKQVVLEQRQQRITNHFPQPDIKNKALPYILKRFGDQPLEQKIEMLVSFMKRCPPPDLRQTLSEEDRTENKRFYNKNLESDIIECIFGLRLHESLYKGKWPSLLVIYECMRSELEKSGITVTPDMDKNIRATLVRATIYTPILQNIDQSLKIATSEESADILRDIPTTQNETAQSRLVDSGYLKHAGTYFRTQADLKKEGLTLGQVTSSAVENLVEPSAINNRSKLAENKALRAIQINHIKDPIQIKHIEHLIQIKHALNSLEYERYDDTKKLGLTERFLELINYLQAWIQTYERILLDGSLSPDDYKCLMSILLEMKECGILKPNDPLSQCLDHILTPEMQADNQNKKLLLSLDGSLALADTLQQRNVGVRELQATLQEYEFEDAFVAVPSYLIDKDSPEKILLRHIRMDQNAAEAFQENLQQTYNDQCQQDGEAGDSAKIACYDKAETTIATMAATGLITRSTEKKIKQMTPVYQVLQNNPAIQAVIEQRKLKAKYKAKYAEFEAKIAASITPDERASLAEEMQAAIHSSGLSDETAQELSAQVSKAKTVTAMAAAAAAEIDKSNTVKEAVAAYEKNSIANSTSNTFIKKTFDQTHEKLKQKVRKLAVDPIEGIKQIFSVDLAHCQDKGSAIAVYKEAINELSKFIKRAPPSDIKNAIRDIDMQLQEKSQKLEKLLTPNTSNNTAPTESAPVGTTTQQWRTQEKRNQQPSIFEPIQPDNNNNRPRSSSAPPFLNR